MRYETSAMVITDNTVEERMVHLTVVEHSEGKGEFIINIGDAVITLPLDKLKSILGGD